MADAFLSSIPILKLNGDKKKYEFWSIKMKTYFCAKDWWDVVSNGYTVPDDFSTLTVEEKKLLEENQRRDFSALLALQTKLTDKCFSIIMSAKTSKAAWDLLKEEFQDNNKFFFVAPDPFAADSTKGYCATGMEFNEGTSSPVYGNRRHKSKNKKRDEGRPKAAATAAAADDDDRDNNTPPGSDIISGLARESELKDDSSSSKKRKASNHNSEENMERGQKMKKRLFDDPKP